MKTFRTFGMLLLFALLALQMISCSSSTNEEAKKKITLIADDSGFDDMSFNYSGKLGMERLVNKYGISATYQTAVLDGERHYLLSNSAKNSDLTICLGYTFADDLRNVAQLNSSKLFSVVDYLYTEGFNNVHSSKFEVNQATMPLGYLSANFVNNMNNDNYSIAFIGGADDEEINKFLSGYRKGIEYYNSKYQKNISLTVDYIDSFDDSAAAYQVTKQRIDAGAKVIFPPAGKSGFGAFAAALDGGAYAVGYDSDCWQSMPAFRSIMLSSCLKRIDNAVYAAGEHFIKNNRLPDTPYIGTLENEGVGMAPYYDLETQIPDSTKGAVSLIIQAIIKKEIVF